MSVEERITIELMPNPDRIILRLYSLKRKKNHFRNVLDFKLAQSCRGGFMGAVMVAAAALAEEANERAGDNFDPRTIGLEAQKRMKDALLKYETEGMKKKKVNFSNERTVVDAVASHTIKPLGAFEN